jgi:4-hydroxy-tetrahydrodipicolinate synthase
MAGTGTPSLEESIELTCAAFDLGYDGVVVLPPYFYRKASDEGLFAWFDRLIHRAVPSGGTLIGYHIPNVTGIALSFDLLARLKDAFPDQFAGIKDSSADPEHAVRLGERFGQDLMVYSGTDSYFKLALEHSAVGSITALANLRSPDSRIVWETFQQGQVDEAAHARLKLARAVMDHYPPNPPLYKALISRLHSFPDWGVRPPLTPHPPDLIEAALQEALTKVEGFAM